MLCFWVFQFINDLVATRTWNNKETLKLLKKIYNLHPKLYKLNLVDTIWGSLTQKKKNLEDVNLMKYTLQRLNIHDCIESKLNLEVWRPLGL